MEQPDNVIEELQGIAEQAKRTQKLCAAMLNNAVGNNQTAQAGYAAFCLERHARNVRILAEKLVRTWRVPQA